MGKASLTTSITYTIDSNTVNLQKQEEAVSPSKRQPLPAALRMLWMQWTVLITDEQPWTTRPDQNYKHKESALGILVQEEPKTLSMLGVLA